ncbi:uncharacterized protein EV154DRAFT_484930 [Mucor mucedo]|uniref:uncharacterized protein n=1 Tax=Mucor mucedo TaxID=29922 RepID=UPI00221FB442|nr:uncharacterized protein EV154DRAFT_484930 [Mucor mucedo]KAI7887627.1 hypothetical protein EV154DRAFT_484930 [Mucor mucedo]
MTVSVLNTSNFDRWSTFYDEHTASLLNGWEMSALTVILIDGTAVAILVLKLKLLKVFAPLPTLTPNAAKEITTNFIKDFAHENSFETLIVNVKRTIANTNALIILTRSKDSDTLFSPVIIHTNSVFGDEYMCQMK